MARVLMDGFENGTLDLGWGQLYTTSAVIDSTKAGRQGSYCVQFTASQCMGIILPDTKPSLYLAVKIAISSITSGDRSIIEFREGGTVLGSIHVVQAGMLLRLYRGYADSILATSTNIVPATDWFLLEAYYLPHASAGTFTAKVNGIEYASATGVATASATTNISTFAVGSLGGNISLWMDDIILDDASWVGPSSIQALVPTGAGATTQWDPSTGSNYACVDEVPVSDTDYIYTNTANEVDTYACSNLTGTINSVKAVQVQARCMQEGSPAVPKIQLITQPDTANLLSASKDVQTFTPKSVFNVWQTYFDLDYAHPGGSGDRRATITQTNTITMGGTPTNLLNGDNTGGDTSTFFNGASGEIKWDFGVGASKVINEMKWYQSNSVTHGLWKIQGSNNDSDWTDLTSNFTLGGGETTTYPIVTSVGYRYYKLLYVSGTVSSDPWLREVEFQIGEATGEPFTEAIVNGMEIGVKAVAT